MNVRNIPFVEDLPVWTFVRWRAYEVVRPSAGREKHVHLVGRLVNERGGRVSSAVQSFDPATRRAVTRSGRVYVLQVEPGFDEDAQYFWHTWQKMQQTSHVRDVTLEFAAGFATGVVPGA